MPLKKPNPASDPLRTLARFLTDYKVAMHSIALDGSCGKMLKDQAVQFFELRSAMGIDGYSTETEALISIRNVLGKKAK